MDFTLTLPGGERLEGLDPVVVIGPNGSGKTRQTRSVASSVPIEFINALRNTRVASELPAVGMDTARNNFNNQKNQSRHQHWELASEFDFMLSQLLAQQSMAALDFARRYRLDRQSAGEPDETPLTQVEDLWGEVFPGRELVWRDWKPVVRNSASGAALEYSANQMSDGEKAALYLAGRVFTAGSGILVVDEPETHFHSLFAVKLWNALEKARSDIRFVYVTHDLPFAMSRRDARFVVASPLDGLRVIDVRSTIPDDVAEVLLGSASLSFYASRVVFCEGDSKSLDIQLYEAWFSGPDTVVRTVGDCQRVMRCVDALRGSGIASALAAHGVVDGDFHPDTFRAALPPSVTSLAVHEVESLFCLPRVVKAVSEHLGRPFEEVEYSSILTSAIPPQQSHQLIIGRWKRRIEPHLEGLVAGVSKRQTSVESLVVELPSIFDHERWPFSPQAMLEEERLRVEAALTGGDLGNFLAIVPGKPLLPLAARYVGMTSEAFVKLVVDSLKIGNPTLEDLGGKIEVALGSYLPPRFAAVRMAAPVSALVD